MVTPAPSNFNLDNIPPGVKKIMLGYLPAEDLKNLEFAQELFQNLAKDENLWKQLAASYNITLYEGNDPVMALTVNIQTRVASLEKVFPELAEGHNKFEVYDRIRDYIRNNPKEAFERIERYLTYPKVYRNYDILTMGLITLNYLVVAGFKPSAEMVQNILNKTDLVPSLLSLIGFETFSTILLSLPVEDQKKLLQDKNINHFLNSQFLHYISESFGFKIAGVGINDANSEQLNGLRVALSSDKGEKIMKEIVELYMFWHEKGIIGFETYEGIDSLIFCCEITFPGMQPILESLMKDFPYYFNANTIEEACKEDLSVDLIKYLIQNIKMEEQAEDDLKHLRETLQSSPRPEVRELVNLLPH